ncbi:MAG: permease-like cell division protein FtsX [Candidatus Colwellbacteria bacterium]|nr:permease-like cell division protein FtsX [Candidatus Colwellbacteria bacterium]
MLTAIHRLIKYGIQTFWRQRLLSIATMVVILLALLVFEGLIISGVIANTAINSIQDKIDISIYFKTATSEDEMLRIKSNLEQMTEVKSVEYVSRDEALESFRERHKGDVTISQAVEELEENPLSASLNIKAGDPSKYSIIANYLNNNVSGDLVEKITYNENQVVIDRLASIIKVSRQVGLLAALFLTIVAILVAFNTILLGIYSNRDEISIMRLVGASNIYVRGPFVVMGVIYGLITAVISIALVTPVVWFAAPYVKLFIPAMDLREYFTSHFFLLVLYQLLFGIGIGVISSFIAIRRYLKV